MSRQQVETKLVRNYSASGGRNAEAQPWGEILATILSLIGGGCNARRVRVQARRHPDSVKEMIAEKLKEQGSFSAKKDRDAAVEAVHRTLLTVTERDLDELIEESR